MVFVANCLRATGGRHPEEFIRSYLTFHAPLIGQAPPEERQSLAEQLRLEAITEITELIAARAIIDAAEADAAADAARTR